MLGRGSGKVGGEKERVVDECDKNALHMYMQLLIIKRLIIKINLKNYASNILRTQSSWP